MTLVVVALVGVLLLSQALVAVTAPAGGRAETGRLLGKTGFAFLGGLRTFAAAVLWNRLEPQFHEYYGGVALADQLYALPAMELIQRLDPQFLQVYYISSWQLATRGDMKRALEEARLGVANNPDSGLLRANLAQILMVQDKKKNLPEMVEQANLALSGDLYWTNKDDLFESLVIFRTVYSLSGNHDGVKTINERLDELVPQGSNAAPVDPDTVPSALR